MNKETIGTQTIYTKKNPVRKKKMPFRDKPEVSGAKEEEQPKKVYYEPLFGTPECTYTGKKRGRKSMEERKKPCLKVESKTVIMYFD